MSKETKFRFDNAVRAMNDIGIKEDKVKPVLKALLKVYNKNWVLIEKENYRALADAIFDKDETEGHLEEEAQEADEPERPLKRFKRGYRGQTSSLNTCYDSTPTAPLVRCKEESDEQSETHRAKLNGPRVLEESPQKNAEKTMTKPLAVTSQSLGQSNGKQPSSSTALVHENGDPGHSKNINRSQQSLQSTNEHRLPSHSMRLRDRGTAVASLQTPSKDKRLNPKSSSKDVQLKEPKGYPATLLSTKKKKTASHTKPKDEPITNDMHCSKVPVVMTNIEYARGAKASDDSVLNRYYSRSGAKVTQPKFKAFSPPLDNINGGSQLNKLDAEDEIVINSENQGSCAEEMNDQRSIHDVIDIAKGQENIVITLVNEVNDERPPYFCYIRHNAIFQNAYANFSLARIADNNCCATCSGDCLSLSIPCACSYETGGEFAYTADGLVKEELLKECISMNRDPKKHCQFFCQECPLQRSKPCRGHLVRKFIKECWIKCGCNMQCGNRVVQRGISRKLQVFMTPEGKGWGLRTLEDLPKGAFVCEYVGEVLTNMELFERVPKKQEGKHSYPVLLDADWCAERVLKDEEALCLDATYYGNVARFINHKCSGSNLVEIPVEVETLDHHYYHLAFFTTRKVKAMEELTWDYGIDFDDHEHPIKAFSCQCGSKFCRNIKRSRARASRRWSQ